MNYNDIKNVFLKLTEYNTPRGKEDLISKYLPDGFVKDEIGNYYYVNGDSRTMFTAHMDDASWGHRALKVRHVIRDNMIHTDGSSVLGADDKAGVTVLLYLLHHNVPGTYYLFIGEESGMYGSKWLLRHKKKWLTDNFDRCVSFDRRGYGSIISRQIGRVCCSDKFVDSLIEEYDKTGLPHRNDPGGIYTDSAAFIGTIPECTNISVGYFSEHTHSERQDINYLERLAIASSKVNWEKLPTVGVKSSGGSYYDDDRYYYYEGW